MEYIILGIVIIQFVLLTFVVMKLNIKESGNKIDVDKHIKEIQDKIINENSLLLERFKTSLSEISKENEKLSSIEFSELKSNIKEIQTSNFIQLKDSLNNSISEQKDASNKLSNELSEEFNKLRKDTIENSNALSEKLVNQLNETSKLNIETNSKSIENVNGMLNKISESFNASIKILVNENTDTLEKFRKETTTNLNMLSEKLVGELSETSIKNLKASAESMDNVNKVLDRTSNVVESRLNLMAKENGENSEKLMSNITLNIDKLVKIIEGKLDNISENVDKKLNSQFEKADRSYEQVIKSIEIIRNSQNELSKVNNNIEGLQNILNDKKSRGIFGETQLNHILRNVFGEGNEGSKEDGKIYKIQWKLENGTIADSCLFLPKPLNNVVIDSKFPLEKYNQYIENREDNTTRKEFINSVKKHINDINEKYVGQVDTSDQAFMFLPSETIFADINAYFPEILELSYKKKVYIVSPTTLMSQLTIIQTALSNIKQAKYSNQIKMALDKLSEEFDRYNTRWTAITKDIEKISKDTHLVTVTSNKISKQFSAIKNIELDSFESSELLETK